MRQTFWDKLNQFPPIVCRLLARTRTERGGVRALTAEEIGNRAGLSTMEVQSISWLTNWETVPVSKIKQFTEACGVKLTDRTVLRVQSSYIRRGASFKYLKRSPDWLSFYKPMIIAYVSTRRTS